MSVDPADVGGIPQEPIADGSPPIPEPIPAEGRATADGGWEMPDGTTYGPDGSELAREPEPEPAEEPEPEPEPERDERGRFVSTAQQPAQPAQQPQAQAQPERATPGQDAYTQQERDWMRAEWESFDVDRQLTVQAFMSQRMADIAAARVLATQAASDPDPERGLTQQYMHRLLQANPGADVQQARVQARLSAAFDLGQRDGDPLSRVERAIAELRGTNGAGKAPKAPAAPQKPAARVIPPAERDPAARVPSNRRTVVTQTTATGGERRLAHYMEMNPGISVAEARELMAARDELERSRY